MKKFIIAALLSATFITGSAQEIGISVSALLPTNGQFSIPIAPLAIRGLGINIGNNFSIASGLTLYRMSGMNLLNTPFENSQPLVGPFYSLLIPLEGILRINFGSRTYIKINGGGVMVTNFGGQMITGNFDRALMNSMSLDALNTTTSYSDKIGFGWNAGIKFVQYVNSKFGISLQANYLSATNAANVSGSYVGFDSNGVRHAADFNYDDVKLDYSGYEISIGVVIQN